MTEELNPQELAAARRAEIDRLIEENGGSISPAKVVAAASDPASPLHSLFQWDDTDAARQWREHQARLYLRAVCVVIPVPGSDEPQRFRAYLSRPSERGGDSYHPIARVLTDTDLYNELLQEALKELNECRKRYKGIKELARVFDALDAVQIPA